MDDRATKKQQELLQFIDGFIKGNGYGPSYREVMRALGYKSVSTVAVHVDQLIAKGYLEKRTRSARSLAVVRTHGIPEVKRETKLGQEAAIKLVEEYVEKLQDDIERADDVAVLRRAVEILRTDTEVVH